MRYVSGLVALVALAFFALAGMAPSEAQAACNATCQSKCRATASDYGACVSHWSKINGAAAARCRGEGSEAARRACHIGQTRPIERERMSISANRRRTG